LEGVFQAELGKFFLFILATIILAPVAIYIEMGGQDCWMNDPWEPCRQFDLSLKSLSSLYAFFGLSILFSIGTLLALRPDGIAIFLPLLNFAIFYFVACVFVHFLPKKAKGK
jgi:hypothetical protein